MNTTSAGTPQAMITVEGIPDALQQRPQWVLWRSVIREGKATKLPFQVNGKPAESNKSSTWTTFDAVLTRYDRGGFDGIGYVFAADDPFVGIDLDSCRSPETGIVAPWAQRWIDRFATYTEISPSETGVKLIGIGTNPLGKGGNVKISEQPSAPSKAPGVEIYDRLRYFAITGGLLADCPATIETIDPAALEEFVRTYWPANRNGNGRAHGQTRSELVERCWKYVVKMPDAISGQGGHNATFAAACECFKFGLTDGEAIEVMRRFNETKTGGEPWGDRDLQHKINDAREDVTTGGEFGCRLNEESNDRTHHRHNRHASGATSNGQQIRQPGDDPKESDEAIEISADKWPDPLDQQAYRGLVGEIVDTLAPHTESDPVAILIQILVGFGSIIGRCAHFRAEADRHYCNLFACLVGQTAKGRKGTSWGQTRRILETIDPEWTEHRILGGLASGEGLIWQCRDPIFKREPIREGGKKTGRILEYQEVETDPGVDDKRLLVMESEFAGVLKVASRERNTLSAIIRQAWDTGSLRTLSKNAPGTATDAHISIVGHITRDELKRLICDTDLANGLANRFLWLCVRRSKCLPEGGDLESVNLSPIIGRLHQAVTSARMTGEVVRDDQAREVWRQIYPDLSEGKPGLLGAATSRSEAQTMRLATIYALLDQSPVIRVEHLVAGLAVWTYAEQSARYIFGSALGDPIADEILRALRQAGADGLTRTVITADVFKRNVDKQALDNALFGLLDAGRIRSVNEPTGGRPIERWFIVGA